MNAKEALEILKNERYSTKFFPAIMVAFEALEKQIPLKVTNGVDFYRCPSCEKVIYVVLNYCGCCGQKLDWE